MTIREIRGLTLTKPQFEALAAAVAVLELDLEEQIELGLPGAEEQAGTLAAAWGKLKAAWHGTTVWTPEQLRQLRRDQR